MSKNIYFIERLRYKDEFRNTFFIFRGRNGSDQR